MNHSTPAALHQYAVETSPTPNGSVLTHQRDHQFGELPQSDLRQLVAAMVD